MEVVKMMKAELYFRVAEIKQEALQDRLTSIGAKYGVDMYNILWGFILELVKKEYYEDEKSDVPYVDFEMDDLRAYIYESSSKKAQTWNAELTTKELKAVMDVLDLEYCMVHSTEEVRIYVAEVE